MTDWPSQTGTSIAHLRIRTGGSDPRGAATHLARQLRSARLTPASLSERAVLCVRRIRDPRAGSVRIHTAGMLSLDWEQAVRDRLDSISASALRPAHTRVASSAEAVLFADTAELLACLASDLCAGYAHERWWWRSLYGERDLKHLLLGALLEPPNSVPSVLEHLARHAQTIAFVQRLTEREVDELITGMLTAFGLVELQAALTSPVVSGHDRPKRPRADATQSTSAPRHATRGDARQRPTPSASPPADSDRPPLPPWAGLVPESADPGLSPRQQLLLGVALLLGRSPRSVRSADFVRATRAWWAETTRPSLSPADVSPVSERQLGGQLARTTWRRSVTTPASGVSRNATRPSPTPGIVRHHPRERSRPATLPPVEGPPNTEPAIDSEPAWSHEPPSREPRAADPVPDTVVIHTQLGGIFYLLNVGIALDLYGDFTQPLRPGIDLSIWDFLTLVARRLLRRHYPADPIWELLRELAGRGPRQAPGADFSPPAEWLAPADWLIAASHRHSSTRRRRPVDQWLDRLMPYLRARLRHALGTRRDQPPGELVCRHSARVMLTPVYLDVYFALDALPISIRLAGLDRDPGWIPAAGRQVAFHFD